MPALPLFIAGYDPSLSRAMICFAFMVLEKYQNFAVPVRNVGYTPVIKRNGRTLAAAASSISARTAGP
jgi:hypothetical protein